MRGLMVVNIKPENKGKKSEQRLADQFQANFQFSCHQLPFKLEPKENETLWKVWFYGIKSGLSDYQ